LLWTSFLRFQTPHENPQVTYRFAGVFPAKVIFFSFFVFCHESLGNSAGIPADFPADLCMSFPADFAAFFLFFLSYILK